MATRLRDRCGIFTKDWSPAVDLLDLDSNSVHPVFCLSFVISTWVTCMSYFTKLHPA